MSEKTDTLSGLINPIYFRWMREAITQHGKINVQALAKVFNILPSNTYFRNFLKDNQQDYLGVKAFVKILNSCNFTLKIVVIHNSKEKEIQNLDLITKNSFESLKEVMSEKAFTLKRKNVLIKKKKVIKNINLIRDSLMQLDTDSCDSLDDMFDDEIVIGTGLDFDLGEPYK